MNEIHNDLYLLKHEKKLRPSVGFDWHMFHFHEGLTKSLCLMPLMKKYRGARALIGSQKVAA